MEYPYCAKPGEGDKATDATDANAVSGAAEDSTDVAGRFVSELADHWQRCGKAAFDAALSKDPVRYVTLAAKLMAGDGSGSQGEGGLVDLLARLNEDD